MIVLSYFYDRLWRSQEKSAVVIFKIAAAFLFAGHKGVILKSIYFQQVKNNERTYLK